MSYSISEAAKRTRTPGRRLLAWEQSLYLDPPLRRKGQRIVRAYSDADIAIILRVKELLQQGYTLRAAFRQARAELLLPERQSP